MRLIFIRHGEPDYERDSLTPKGWKEAELLAERVKTWENVTGFYCSPLGRARDTASLSMKKLGREAEIADWLTEFHVTITDPQTGTDRNPWDFLPSYWTNEEMMYDRDKWFLSPVMQTGEVEKRFKQVCTGIDGLLAAHGYVRQGRIYRTEEGNQETLVFFCHFGVTFAIISHLLGIAAPPLWQGIFTAPSSVTELVSEERVKGEAYFRCRLIGDISHLYAGHEPASKSGFYNEVFG